MKTILPELYEGIKHFTYVQGKSALEVGPFDGYLTEYILKENPSKLFLLESNSSAVETLQTRYGRNDLVTVVDGDMHYDFDKIGIVDVAILYGVIYHSHAPLLVLEELVNHCNPEMILIDGPLLLDVQVAVVNEKTNDPGMRYTRTSLWKTVDMVTVMSKDSIVNAMKNLGYVCSEEILPSRDSRHWKAHACNLKFDRL
jgi:16S rRNA A1518/A1519 N6-dimethyltransferase RsmA/KsgA/DIM1 with predicted DNA glycosylase/AP lyase activity